jgi:sensor domain CHASE-containing protein
VSGRGGIFVLNETAETLWELMAVPQSRDELARHLTKHFDVSEDRARQDVDHVLGDMQDRGVVRIASSGGASHPEDQ